MNTELRAAAAAYESAMETESAAWAAFNVAMEAARAELAHGALVSWAGERALRWIPADVDPRLADGADTYLVAGVTIDPARGNPPSDVIELAAKHRLAPLMEACARADDAVRVAAVAFARAPCLDDCDKLEKAALIIKLHPDDYAIDELIEGATALTEQFAEEEAVLPPHDRRRDSIVVVPVYEAARRVS